MGLDFSHGNAHWAYSGFNLFRRAICKSIGIIDNLDTEIYKSKLYLELKDDDIFPLINHSDCEGIVTHEDIKQIIPRLQAIISQWSEEDGYVYEFNRAMAEEFISGMSEAVEKNELFSFM